MAEPFSFFDTTLDKPKEDYTSALLGKKPKENAFASPQVNPMMAQTQILGQAPVAQAPMPVAQAPVVQPQVAPMPVEQAPILGQAPYPQFEGQDFFNINPGAVPLTNPDGSYRPMPTRSDVPVMSAGTVTREDLRMSPSGILTEQKTPFEVAGAAISGAVGTERMSSEQYRAKQESIINDQLAAGENAFATGEGLDDVTKEAIANATKMAASPVAGTTASTVADMAPIDPNSPQANFLREKERLGGQPMTNDQIAQATRLAASMGTTFDPETGYSRDAFLAGEPAPRPSNLTTVGGAPLNEFLSGAAMPDQGFARAENAMYGDESVSRGLGGDAAIKAFQDASEAREARLGFDNRPGVDVPSLAMQRSRMDAGLDPVEGSPTGTDMSQQQQRDALERGFDPATGQPIQSGDDGMTPYQRASLQWQKDKFTAEQSIAGYKQAIEAADTAEEKAKIKTEMETKERDLFSMHQDAFERQERYIEQSLKNTGKSSTGFGGSFLKFVKGSKASDLNESLKPILGEAAFGRLQQMREASKTGGALGAISERELDLLQSAMGALNSSQSESQFRSNLLAYQKQLRESNKRMKEAYNGQFGNGQSGNGQSGGSSSPRYSNDQDAGGSIDDILLPKSK